VVVNNRKAQLELTTRSGRVFPLPFVRMDPRPSGTDRIVSAYVDRELAGEAVTYVLASGVEGAVHIDQALEYNRDPEFLAELMIHKLTVEAEKRVGRCGISRRELARRLKTSMPQLYRLLDPTNTRKSLGQLVALLHLLDCDVELVIHPRRAA
jgi:hypothetical protein